MGRKNKSKNNTVGETSPPTLPQKAEQPQMQKQKKVSNRTYLKVKAIFQCSQDNCKHTWESFHAWKQNEKIYCDICEGKAKIVDSKDEEKLELANYYCKTASCEREGYFWQSIHNGETWRTEYCDRCGSGVLPNGTQERAGRHFWYVCKSKGCGESWEDFSIELPKTQKCSICKQSGVIIGTRRIRENMDNRRGWGHPGAVSHNWECCDMCQKLKEDGIAMNCLKYWKVQSKLERQVDGEVTERVLEVK